MGIKMDISFMQEILEKISADLVLAEISDQTQMAQLHTCFEKLAEAASGDQHKIIRQAAQLAADLVQKIILEEVADPDATIETINATVSALQAVIRDERALDEVVFPTELKLYETMQHMSSSSEKPKITLPANVDEHIFEEFIASKSSDIDELENLLLRLEKEADQEDSAALKRIIHTIKGESAIIGLNEIENLCHKAEDLIETYTIDKIIDVLFKVKDWLSAIFEFYSGNGENPGKPSEILNQIKEKIAAPEQTAAEKAAPKAPEMDEIEEELSKDEAPDQECENKLLPVAGDLDNLMSDLELLTDFITESYEHLETADVHMLVLETDPSNYDSLNAVFRSFHTIKGVAGFLDLKEMSALAHEAENLLDQARKGLISLTGDVSQLGFEALDAMKRLVGNLEKALNSGIQPDSDCDVPALIQKLKLSQSSDETKKTVDTDSKKASEDTSESAVDFDDAESYVFTKTDASLKITAASDKPDEQEEKAPEMLTEAEEIKTPVKQTGISISRLRESVKVDADRLDRLVDTIGELVIAETMVSQLTQSLAYANTELAKSISQLDKITRELQEMGTGLRMVPIRPIFQKMARLVRDLSIKMHKPVGFVMNGEETELDKTVVDKISDPLVHLLRNALDHGLEDSADERQKAGKPEKGTVTLRAYHKGGNIVIDVMDDGRGLDREKILKKAIKQGIVNADEPLSDREIFNLVFEPGFSTAKKVTDVSGRGVGMDVVKKNIAALRGRVDIQSESGRGSTFSIRLPLTMAIIEGMVIRVGNERYIIPTLSITTSFRPQKQDLNTVVKKGEMVSLHGNLLPLFRLSKIFKLKNSVTDATQGLAVVVESDGHQVALLTDELLGQQQIVIKSLGAALQGIPGISGGAILPDGHVGLILDISGLIALAHGNIVTV
jgi:two-component system, chemotaxis family, sensor kinase CheA